MSTSHVVIYAYLNAISLSVSYACSEEVCFSVPEFSPVLEGVLRVERVPPVVLQHCSEVLSM